MLPDFLLRAIYGVGTFCSEYFAELTCNILQKYIHDILETCILGKVYVLSCTHTFQWKSQPWVDMLWSASLDEVCRKGGTFNVEKHECESKAQVSKPPAWINQIHTSLSLVDAGRKMQSLWKSFWRIVMRMKSLQIASDFHRLSERWMFGHYSKSPKVNASCGYFPSFMCLEWHKLPNPSSCSLSWTKPNCAKRTSRFF